MYRLLAVCLVLIALSANAQGQDQTIPTATQWTLDAAGPTQRTAIRSVVLLRCQDSKGTGFVLKNGIVVTNWHVVEGCNAEQVTGTDPNGTELKFSKMVTDSRVDLTLLRPARPVSSGGLELGPDQSPAIGTPVSAWGYPFRYNGPSPLLTVGYVAGYSADEIDGRKVKHIIINGAINPGNSGGPLFRAADDKVIGVVVAKYHLYPPFVRKAIDAMSRNKSGVVYTGTDAEGRPVEWVEGQIVAMVLDQFYRTTQVMIGQAIALPELKQFIKIKEAELH